MIIIVDGGASKADWAVLQSTQDNDVYTISTPGFTPIFHDVGDMVHIMEQNPTLIAIATAVKEIYFFGAGVSSPRRRAIVKQALGNFFANTPLEKINVDHDLTAAAYATCGHAPGIACILGTGSNSCYFDGHKVHEVIKSLDYILGDEGSGTWFGKHIVAQYLYKRLPNEISAYINEHHPITTESVLKRVYNQEHPKKFLAQFAKVMQHFAEHPYFLNLQAQGFGLFLDIHVCCYKNYQQVPVHFVGSIANVFKPILQQELNKRGIIEGKYIRKPINGLVNFYKN